MRKIAAIGGIVFISFILTIVAMFTKLWISWSIGKFSYGIGIVPYHSNSAGWFTAASWMVFISFGLFIPLILVVLFTAYKVHHDGCCHSIRHCFNSICLICSIIAVLEIIAFVLMAVNASRYVKGASISLGSSAYLDLVSAILIIVATVLSGHASHHDCHWNSF